MPKIEAVWGIDIGNCSLKALRCRPGRDPASCVADAFDYIEYPKILTQPGAEPAERSRRPQQFLSRNGSTGPRGDLRVGSERAGPVHQAPAG